MRSLRAPLAFIGLTVAAGGLWGQMPATPPAPSPYPAAAAIVLNQADVYAGPGSAFYATVRLRYNDRVIVLGESKKQAGWLEIAPPAGSFSWIDAKYVKTIAGVDKIGIVDTGDPKVAAPVLPGSSLVSKEPNVEIARVVTGTQLLLLDRPTAASGGTSYYPIAPVANEVRFLPIEAVRGGTYAGNTPIGGWQQTSGPATIPTAWQTNNGSFTPQQPPTTFVQYAQQGDQQLAAGNPERARLLYLEALGQTNDPSWKNYLNGQLARISQGAAPAGQSPYQTASGPTGNAIPAYGQQPGMPPSGPPPANPPTKQWSPWGTLRTSTIAAKDGQPMYVLEDRQNGKAIVYVTTVPGFTLRDYVGQTVCVYGVMTYLADDYIRTNVITAEQVATPQAGGKQ